MGGPSFEDLRLEQAFEEAPGMTVTSGHAALHQALAGDRLCLALDAPLCRAVSGRDAPLVHRNLVCDVAIGQSTGPTQRVRGNSLSRGLVLARPVFVGDTLRRRTKVVGLKQNRRREGAQTTGLVALRMTTVDKLSRPGLDFWRCPMLPLTEPDGVTGHADDFEDIAQLLASSAVERSAPSGWDPAPLRDAAPGLHHAELVPCSAFAVERGETVRGAPELSSCVWRAPRRWARAAARRGCALSCQRSGAPASGRSCSNGDSWPSWPRKVAE